MINDTIVAISTALSEAAISIVRLSGPQAIAIASSLFNRDLESVKSFSGRVGQIIDPQSQKIVDEVIVNIYRKPKTYTCEDLVEINCHGGVLVTKQILALCLGQGARMAEPGEFTQRAFLNGRIDLAQAEATLDMIHAQTQQSAHLAAKGISGCVKRLVEPLMKQIMDIIAHIETNIDYPEYTDVAELSREEVYPRALDFKKKVEAILEQAQTGQIIKDGLNTVILGRPNVGKSSLLNALLEEDKAIVTEVAGTTRDLVEGWIRLKNVTLHLIDTAGLRETDDVVEQIGIDRSKKAMSQAQLVIVLLDGSQPLTAQDEWLLNETKSMNRIIVTNKTDIGQPHLDSISISAKNHDISPLVDEINRRYQHHSEIVNHQTLLSNQRQIGCMNQAYYSILKVIEGLENEVELDLINLDLTLCYKQLASILMPVDEVDLMSEIFSRFCLGK